jgi:hypothetical protein
MLSVIVEMSGVEMDAPRGWSRNRRTGFVDESYATDRSGRLVHVLGMSEIVVDAEAIREALRELAPTHRAHLHFRNENDDRKVDLAAAMSQLGLRLTAVVCRTEQRAERARGLCVRDLAWAVKDRLDGLAFESRGPRRNRHDASVVRGLLPQGVDLGCWFPGKHDEPLLWPADFLAGAVRQALTGAGGGPLAALGDVEIREV